MRSLDYILSNRRGLTIDSYNYDLDVYLNSQRNLLFINTYSQYKSVPRLTINWGSKMYFTLYENHFMFSTMNKQIKRWESDIEINYNIEREFFEQLKFVIDVKTFEYKTLKHLISIKNEFFKACNYDKN